MAIECSDWNDLDAIRNDLTGDYVLVNDIDENSAGYDTHASETANDGEGWLALGDDQENEDLFTGTFDMSGYEIRDLYIDRPNSNRAALFGMTDSANPATFQNGTIEIISVDGNFGPAPLLAIVREGVEVLDIVTKGGTVTSHRTDNVGSPGGVCGTMQGTIKRCYSYCNVEQTVYDGPCRVGGLCGVVRNNGQAIDCGAEGDVSGGTGGQLIGGLVGEIFTQSDGETPKIINCYARGSVTGDGEVGGLVGQGEADQGSTDKFTIEKSYSTGTVSGNTNVGGFIGNIETGSDYDILDSFWDTETSGQSTSAGDETGKTTAEMKDRDTFTDTATSGLSEAWDMALVDTYDETKTWGIGDLDSTTINDGYPFLMTFQVEPQPVISHTTDILTFLKGIETHTTDLLTFKQPIIQHSVDIITDAPGLEIHTVDIITQKTDTKTHTVDTLAFTENVVTNTTDIITKIVGTEIHTVDISTLLTLSESHTVDIATTFQATEQHTIDLITKSTFVKTHTVDILVEGWTYQPKTTDTAWTYMDKSE